MDFNKEIPRMNAYNLVQSVDDLCDVAIRDPILGELQEMVHDTHSLFYSSGPLHTLFDSGSRFFGT